MFEYFKNLIEEAKRKQEEEEKRIKDIINSSKDEVIWKTSFLPLSRWWASFKTHTLIIDDFWNIIFKVKMWFPIIFIVAFWIPLIVTTIKIFIDIVNGEILNIDSIWMFIWEILFSLIFLIPIFLIFYFTSKSKIFDFQNWYYYDLRNQKKLFELLNNEKYKNKIIPIKEIHALQILKKRVTWKNSSYDSFELNMILRDSSRINIIDHWNLEEIRKNADELSNKLRVKIYDITNLNLWPTDKL